jgi:hypothetical protein
MFGKFGKQVIFYLQIAFLIFYLQIAFLIFYLQIAFLIFIEVVFILRVIVKLL